LFNTLNLLKCSAAANNNLPIAAFQHLRHRSKCPAAAAAAAAATATYAALF
jgi:hypothetical protein